MRRAPIITLLPNPIVRIGAPPIDASDPADDDDQPAAPPELAATRSKVSAAVKSSPALAPGKPTDVKPSGFARFFSNVSLVAGCLWIVIGLSFLLTAGTNWHATILTEAVMLDVDVNNESVKKIFGMRTLPSSSASSTSPSAPPTC